MGGGGSKIEIHPNGINSHQPAPQASQPLDNNTVSARHL